MRNIESRIAEAVSYFWQARREQKQRQERSGVTDQGSRGAVTGGGQLDGFLNLVSEMLIENGGPEEAIFRKERVTLPGFFRPTKEWDLLVVINGVLLASIEFKSQVGPSFGNNFNNRTEEALGSATNLWTAYRDGAFTESPQPWLGYFMLLEEAPKSTSPVKVKEPHFPVFQEFSNASYADRYEIFCYKLVRERLYNAACLILSDRETGIKGGFKEPASELSFKNFIASLSGQAAAYVRMKSE